MILNTRSDLEALRGTDRFAVALRYIMGATYYWSNESNGRAEPSWQLTRSPQVLAQFGFSEDEFLSECADAGVSASHPESPPIDGHYCSPPDIVVTQRQARLALLSAGLLDSADAAINSSDQSIQIAWNYASEIRRSDPAISAVGGALGLSTEQIDVLFKYAATL